jgi:type I phosphodiesterase/nucleotide pyrophosphatase
MTLSRLRFGAATLALPIVALFFAANPLVTQAQSSTIKRVLLISVDGMHAVDFQNCANGISTVNNGASYCPAMAALGKTGVNYVAASTTKPSDSFPGLIGIVTGGSPALTGIYYDVAYSRNYDAPAITTGNGLAAGPCTPYAAPTGTTSEYEEGIDIDQTKLNGGAPGAGLTDGGINSIEKGRLIRDPNNGCNPVFPGISSASTPSSASFTALVDTRHGPTSIPHTLRSRPVSARWPSTTSTRLRSTLTSSPFPA